jgi:hypothetical protein
MSPVCAVAVDVLVSVIAVITTIITAAAIIAVVVISSPLARLDLHRLALAARGAGVAQRHMACVWWLRSKTHGRPRRRAMRRQLALPDQT